MLMWSAPMIDLFDGVARVDVDDPVRRRRLLRAWRSWEPPISVVDVDEEVRDAA